MMELKPFLCRPPMLPDESLASYIYRIAQANGHRFKIVESLCRDVTFRRDPVTRPNDSETFNAIAQLMYLPPYKIYWASIHGYTSILVPQHVETETISFENGFTFPKLPKNFYIKHFHNENKVQYCPHCLAEAQYQRRIWRLKVVSACVDHQCLLLNRCPHCEAGILTKDLIRGICGECRQSLLKADCVDLSADEPGLEAQKIIYYWFNASTHEWSTLPREPVREVYAVFLVFMNMVRRIKSGMEGLHSIPDPEEQFAWENLSRNAILQTYVMAATAMQAIQNWPDGLTDFLSRYAYRDGRSYGTNFGAQYSYLFSSGELDRWAACEEYSFIYQAFVDYLTTISAPILINRIKHFQTYPVPADKFDWMQVKEVEAELRIGGNILKRMIANGLIDVKEETQTLSLSNKLLSRADVSELKRRWQNSIPLADAAAIWLGVSEDTVIDLVDEELLEAVRGPGVDGSSAWRISQSSIEELLEMVHIAGESTSYIEYWINLALATAMLSPYGFNEAKVIRLMLRYKLRCKCLKTDLLNKIFFSESDLLKLIEELGSESLISQDDFAKRMRVDT